MIKPQNERINKRGGEVFSDFSATLIYTKDLNFEFFEFQFGVVG